MNDGISAASVATATASISSDVTQSNANSLTGSTTGNNQPLTQNQEVDQDNLNLRAAHDEVRGRVWSGDGFAEWLDDGSDRRHQGQFCGDCGFGDNSNVTQSNTNSASASTTGNGSFIAQAPVDLDFCLAPLQSQFHSLGRLALHSLARVPSLVARALSRRTSTGRSSLHCPTQILATCRFRAKGTRRPAVAALTLHRLQLPVPRSIAMSRRPTPTA